MAYPETTVGSQRVAKSAWPEWQQGTSTVDKTVQYGNALEQRILESVKGHSTTTYVPQDVSQPKKRSSSAVVLDAQTASQNIVLKHRASALIQKYSGSRWREAQRTKWLLDVVLHIDRDYRQFIMEQAEEIDILHRQLEETTGMQAAASAAMQAQNSQLRRRVDVLEQQLRAAQAAVLDMQNRVSASEAALQEAEEASRAAAEECHELQQAVAVLAEHDASARKLLAHQAHHMKEALVASRARVRQAAESSKRHRLEVSDLMSQQRQQAEQERQALTTAHQSSLAAANTLLQAATRLNTDALRLELDAYKEPWQYCSLARDKSPTRRRDITRRLGLKQMSMNTVPPIPF